MRKFFAPEPADDKTYVRIADSRGCRVGMPIHRQFAMNPDGSVASVHPPLRTEAEARAERARKNGEPK